MTNRRAFIAFDYDHDGLPRRHTADPPTSFSRLFKEGAGFRSAPPYFAEPFRCADTGRLFRRESVRRFKAIERQALRKLDMLDAAQDIRTLSTLPGNRLERLTGDRKGQYSIRVNDQWRVCFEWRDGHAYEVEIVDYH